MITMVIIVDIRRIILLSVHTFCLPGVNLMYSSHIQNIRVLRLRSYMKFEYSVIASCLIEYKSIHELVHKIVTVYLNSPTCTIHLTCETYQQHRTIIFNLIVIHLKVFFF